MQPYNVTSASPPPIMQGGAMVTLPPATITSPGQANVVVVAPGTQQTQVCPPAPQPRQVVVQNNGPTSVWIVSGTNVAPFGRRLSGGDEMTLITSNALFASSLADCAPCPIVVFS